MVRDKKERKMARGNPKTEAYRTGRENICKNDYKNAGKIV